MSYERRKTRPAQAAMGDALSDLLACGKTIVGTAASGAVDPYLPEVICRISQLQALSTGRTPIQAMFGKKPTVPVPTCNSTPATAKGKVGLDRAVKPLRALVYVNQHPVVIWAGLTALLGVPLLAGYMIGKARK